VSISHPGKVAIPREIATCDCFLAAHCHSAFVHISRPLLVLRLTTCKTRPGTTPARATTPMGRPPPGLSPEKSSPFFPHRWRGARVQYPGFVAFVTSKSFITAVKSRCGTPERSIFCCIFHARCVRRFHGVGFAPDLRFAHRFRTIGMGKP
jgi:hypothetical protein